MATKQNRRKKQGDRTTATAELPRGVVPLQHPSVATSSPVAEGGTSKAARGNLAEPRNVNVNIRLVCGGITNVKAPIVIGARYDGLAFAGPTKAFDRLLDSWLTRAVDLGIIGSALGQLFPINLEQYHKAGKLKARNLLLAGMGEPGRFAQDSLRFIMSNIVVAVKTMGQNQFATGLIGTRRGELSIGDAIRGLVQGVLDGHERLRAIAGSAKEDKQDLQRVAEQPLVILLVHRDEAKLAQIEEELNTLANAREKAFPNLKLTVDRGRPVASDPVDERTQADAERDEPVTYLRITRSKPAAGITLEKVADPATAPTPFDHFPTDLFQFSALSDLAVIPQREQAVNSHLMRDLAERMTTDDREQDKRAQLGIFFTNLVIPEDFRKLTEGPADLTLEVDETTAAYPWEMAAHRGYAGDSFVSVNVALSRQFRSLISPPPTSPPALNNKLNVLIIADPAPGTLALVNARSEGLAVVDVLEQARIAWGDQYEIKATVRIGPERDEQVDQILRSLRSKGCVVSAEPCDPLELAMLIVNEQYDLVHYAGHGYSDSKTGQSGWVFAADCILSAKEIFRVRQVPRLVFANACFTAVTSDHNEMRKHLASLAQAFFGRGIPNFIGTGWEVDDACAEECARWFYARLMGLRSPSAADGTSGTALPATIGDALRDARNRALLLKPKNSSWGAYQHYGRVSDRLMALPKVSAADGKAPAKSARPITVQVRNTPSTPPSFGDAQMATDGQNTATNPARADPNLVYVNGIDAETGNYAFAPRSIDEIAKEVSARPGVEKFTDVHSEKPRSFGPPFGVDLENPEEAGWGIIFHEDTPQDIRKALEPLIELRRKQVPKRLKVLDYKKGEQTRGWYQRHGISAGGIDPEIVPFYLLLVGGPELIPFEFQYLLGVDYAIGRLSFNKADEYERYARSTAAYESGATVPNTKEIAYWGTRHLGDPATELSASLLIDPLANGIPGAAGALKRAINTEVGYGRTLSVGDDATKANLLEALHAPKPPAMLFTASHGMALRSGQAAQAVTQGALLCQDWPGFGSVRPEHFMAAADIADDANVNGMVALLFACFGAGTPDRDQFLMDLSQADEAPLLAPQPFVAALPRRLLTHPNGSALAVIGHIDRAWGFSIQAPKVSEPQIGAFRNSIGFILSGAPIGYATSGQFGSRFSALSALLASATSPSASAGMRLNDRELVTAWLERNDAQNYVLLGDPAVRIRKDVLT